MKEELEQWCKLDEDIEAYDRAADIQRKLFIAAIREKKAEALRCIVELMPKSINENKR